MWINSSLESSTSDSIFSGQSGGALNEKIDVIVKWATYHPKTTINIWYDSRFVLDNSVDNTVELISKHMEYKNANRECVKDYLCFTSNSDKVGVKESIGNIKFMDIRDVYRIRQAGRVFDQDVPVYFRADLARLMISYSSKSIYSVYADFDVLPLDYDMLFDQESLRFLEEYGIVIARGGPGGFENSFHIIKTDHDYIMNAISWAILDLNIGRCFEARLGNFKSEQRVGLIALSESVFESFYNMFRYLHHLMKKQCIILRKPGCDPIIYDKDRHYLEPFGVHKTCINYLIDEDTLYKQKIVIPTKKVTVPPSHFCG
jgi:hypothetical protein